MESFYISLMHLSQYPATKIPATTSTKVNVTNLGAYSTSFRKLNKCQFLYNFCFPSWNLSIFAQILEQYKCYHNRFGLVIELA
jgi:hypothetical protein